MRDDEFKEFLKSIDQARCMSRHWKLKIWMNRAINSPWFWFGLIIGGMAASIMLI